MSYWFPVVRFAVLLALFSACTSTVPAGVMPPQPVGAWLVYWEGESGLSELEQRGHLFDRVSLFGYELNRNGHPEPAPGLRELFPRFFELAVKHGFMPWVTVVNDVRMDDGTAVLKDAEFLRRLLADPGQRKAHAAVLAAKVQCDGFSGLDLDYEGLDESDQESFRVFVSELADELQHRGLGLNVVLEPRRRAWNVPRTVGSTVMGYNLHGRHSGPGPRATPDFVAGLYVRGMRSADCSARVALALGGFAWAPTGRAQELDWSAARRVANGARDAGRDALTRVPYAHLEDGTEVWFEDVESLDAKWRAAEKAGFRGLMLWRLGGNDNTLFEWLAKYEGKNISE